ncbi:TRAFAC clade GTPase domain-containing protein [Nocardiopsis nanhaiensis]
MTTPVARFESRGTIVVVLVAVLMAVYIATGDEPVERVAFLAGGFIVVLAVALAGALLLLVWVFVRNVHAVLYHGENPRVPELGPDEPAEYRYHGGPAWWDFGEVAIRVGNQTGLFVVFLLPYLLAQALVLLCHMIVAWVGVVVLRLVDGGLLRFRRIRMLCPSCFQHMAYPSYECGGCGRVHRDVRPGRRGVFRRRCVCGQPMPTLLVLGSADLDALCPHCEQRLEHRPGESRELSLALFGGTGAGKTRLTHGFHGALEHAAGAHGGASVELAGAETQHSLSDSQDLLSPGRKVPPTQPGRQARGLVLRVTAERRTLVLQVYDTAGEWFNRSDRAEELTYLGKTTTFVLVLDPLSVPPVWNTLDPSERSRLSEERSHTPDPEQAYMQVRDEVQRQYLALGRGLGRTRLAVVVSRGDLLAGTSIAPADIEPELWAREMMGLDNLLRAARDDFGTVEVFVTSAVSDPGQRPDPSLAELLRWLLEPEADVFTSMLAPEGAAAEGVQ